MNSPSDKNLNSKTLDKTVKENAVLVYTNPVIETITIDQNGNKITHIIGPSYLSFFSNKLMREANFEQIADYCRTSVLKDPSTQILITGDFNTMGVDGRDLDGNDEAEEIINQARNFLPNLGSSFDEIRNFKLILDRINFELYQQTLPENRQNKMKKLKYKESDLPFRGFGIKENILKMLNLILDGTITNLSNLYTIEYKYFGIFDHAQTMVKPITLEEFETKKKQKADQLATQIAIMQIMNRPF